MDRLKEFGKLSPDMKITHLMGELVCALPADSIAYDLNELFSIYPGYEVFVWNAAMLLVERGQLGVLQVKLGKDIHWLMTRNANLAASAKLLSNDEFKCPIKKRGTS